MLHAECVMKMIHLTIATQSTTFRTNLKINREFGTKYYRLQPILNYKRRKKTF